MAARFPDRRHLTPTRGQVADDATGIFLRRDDLDLHHRFEKFRTCELHAFAHAHAGCDFKGENAGVDVVELAVDQSDLEVDDRGSLPRGPLSMTDLNALLNARDVLFRNSTTNDAGLKRIAFARLLLAR